MARFISVTRPRRERAKLGKTWRHRCHFGQNIFTLLADRLAAGDALPASYLVMGDDDSHGLWKEAIAFYETMQANNRPSELRITDGDHVWKLWRSSIVDALTFVDAQFIPSSHVLSGAEKR